MKSIKVSVCFAALLMISGCFAIRTGAESMDLPSDVTGAAAEIVSVDQFDRIEAKAVLNGACLTFSFFARGRFRCRKANKIMYNVPKMVSIGLAPGMKVPREGWKPGLRLPPNRFQAGVLIYVGTIFVAPWIDSLFIEPFSDYRPDLNDSNVAQLGLLGCCKYYDVTKRVIDKEIDQDSEVIVRDTYPLDGLLQIHPVRLFPAPPIQVQLENGQGTIVWTGQFTNVRAGTKVDVSFSRPPALGGDLGVIVARQLGMSKRITLTIEEGE